MCFCMGIALNDDIASLTFTRRVHSIRAAVGCVYSLPPLNAMNAKTGLLCLLYKYDQ